MPKSTSCHQRGICPYWDTCPYHHDRQLCRTSEETAEGTLPLEID